MQALNCHTFRSQNILTDDFEELHAYLKTSMSELSHVMITVERREMSLERVKMVDQVQRWSSSFYSASHLWEGL